MLWQAEQTKKFMDIMAACGVPTSQMLETELPEPFTDEVNLLEVSIDFPVPGNLERSYTLVWTVDNDESTTYEGVANLYILRDYSLAGRDILDFNEPDQSYNHRIFSLRMRSLVRGFAIAEYDLSAEPELARILAADRARMKTAYDGMDLSGRDESCVKEFLRQNQEPEPPPPGCGDTLIVPSESVWSLVGPPVLHLAGKG